MGEKLFTENYLGAVMVCYGYESLRNQGKFEKAFLIEWTGKKPFD